MKPGTINVDMFDCTRMMTLNVRVKRMREFRVRAAIACVLLRAAAWLLGCRLDVEEAA